MVPDINDYLSYVTRADAPGLILEDKILRITLQEPTPLPSATQSAAASPLRVNRQQTSAVSGPLLARRLEEGTRDQDSTLSSVAGLIASTTLSRISPSDKALVICNGEFAMPVLREFRELHYGENELEAWVAVVGDKREQLEAHWTAKFSRIVKPTFCGFDAFKDGGLASIKKNIRFWTSDFEPASDAVQLWHTAIEGFSVRIPALWEQSLYCGADEAIPVSSRVRGTLWSATFFAFLDQLYLVQKFAESQYPRVRTDLITIAEFDDNKRAAFYLEKLGSELNRILAGLSNDSSVERLPIPEEFL